MHSFTHEYKMVKDRETGGLRPSYIGSRCRNDGKGRPFCPESRSRAVLPIVKAHNDSTHDFFGTTGNTRVVKE